ncbi:MAG: VWA domain-containing protein [Ruminococcus sp.]|uniref:VWA domain-containing protein n=1 Tax=Ruminococcus sp. TaxID=41978 RepID=UPI0025F5F6AD|nr:VWA domain-containing protein [Ruminococcus sp.]MBR0529677.1 VWA domain-containing protein [Ruminococcus sp.]
MKERLKKLLTKRVIAGTLSAAMAFNMAAYLPMSAFAHEEDHSETIVDLNEIKVEGQLMSNGYLAMNVLGNGRFSFGTTGGNPDNPKDDDKCMLYGYSGNSTSYTTVRIDDSSYEFTSEKNEFNPEDKNNISSAVYSDVDVKQVLSIVKNPATGKEDLIEIKYIVTNNSDTEKNVGLRIMMDTMLGGNDNAPFRVPQYGSITTETEYTGEDIPQFWQAFDDLTSPSVIAQGRLFETEEDRPDKVQFCNWRSIHGVNWNYHTTDGRGNGDSAVAMTWNEASLAPNESREYVTSYGLSEFTEDMSLPLGLSVYSDSELSVVNNQYAPNPVDVTAYVQNLSRNAAENVKVSIELPEGLTLTNNSDQVIDIGKMNSNQLEQAAWSVYVSPSVQDMTYTYTVVLTADDGYEKRVSRSIHVPALEVEAASPYVLFSGSDTENFTLNCWKSTFNGDVYTGKNFISNASELYLNGNVNAVDSISAYGWKVNIEERNEHIEKEEMPDWDARIIAMADECEISDEDIIKIEDKNIIDGAVRTSGNVVISGTTFDGNCYIITDGNITYNVNDFKSSGRVVLYSRNGSITINGTNIDVNGIMYAPKGKVAFNSNIANINGRIFADRINFSGSIFNVNGSDSDWELLGRKAVIAKTYTLDADFNEGGFDGLGLDIADELTLEQRTDGVSPPSENEYKDNDSVNGIALNVKTDKSVLTNDGENVNVEFDLNGFGSQEVEENNVDLAIVVDTSGSMKNARRDNAVTAAKEVVSKMKPGDRCAIIKFTNSATVLQGFTDDAELLNTAIDKLNAVGGTNIANGINGAVELFDETGSASRQKYIILMSDGEDSSASAQAATDAFGKQITICALAIGSNSRQMETIANNTNGYYKNSPTAEQISEMMNMFADVVFNNAGTDVTFTATINKNASVDTDALTSAPAEVIENENGTKTLKWTFDKITIDQSEKIILPVSINDVSSGLNNIISDMSCTYYDRAGVSKTVYADDLILPYHTYKQEGTWTAVYDSKTAGTEWKNIYWNGKLYDDGVLSVMAQTGDDLDAFGEWTEITNHKDITDLKGRYIRVKVNMAVSASGKTPELYDITLLSDGADKVNYVNNAPIVSVSGNTTTSVSKKITLISTAEDDAFNSKLSFNWNCDGENVQIFGSNKPYASFKFNESGTYDITLSVSDDSSTSVITKTITVLNDDVLVKPMIDIDVPSVVKSGTTINGSISNLNDAEIAEYEVLVGGNTVNVSSDGQFSFTAPDSDTIIAVEAKAFNIVGVSGSADKSIIVDANAPTAELKADSDDVKVNDTVTVTAVINDENGISDYSLTLDGEAVSLDSNYQFSFVPTAIGSYAFELNVTDMAGHTSSASLTINVAEGKAQPVVNYSIPRVIMLGETGDFIFVSDSDAVVTVKVNGETVQLDADGKFSYTPEAVGNLTVDVHATNGGDKYTDFTLNVPVVKIELTSDKSVYTDEEPVTVKLVYSDNITVASQSAAIDNIPYTISNDAISADRLDAGSHEAVWHIEDANGIVYTGVLTFDVQDMTPPDVEVVLSENALKSGDSVEAVITATDRYGIDSISAVFDNEDVVLKDNKAVLNELTAGTHVLEVTAVDKNGVSATYSYEIKVSAGDTTPPELDTDVTVGENNRIKITATAADNSGDAKITGSINGKKLTFDNDGTAYYDPESFGTYEIIIRAEDAAGNYAERTHTVTISEQIKEYELKLSVALDKDKVKPDESVNITAKTNELLENVTISAEANGGKLTQTATGFTFVSDKEGTFKVVISAAVENGDSVSQTVYITVAKEQQIIDDEEEEGEYKNTYTPEARARVILDSGEKTETKMTEEMADLADHLKTPLAVYEYLYNNLNSEFYATSRKGAIGTYEQNGGSDVDCSSLLIAMLRYLGYDAEYVTGEVTITAQQLIDLTGAKDIATAEKIFLMGNRKVTRINGTVYRFTHTWVKANIDDVEYDLDVYLKKYDRVDGISKIADSEQIQNAASDLKDPADIFTAANSIDVTAVSEDLSIGGKAIHQVKISKLPSKVRFEKAGETEKLHDIITSTTVQTDKLYLGFNGDYQQSISAPKLVISSISIGYVPNDSIYDLLGDGSKPRDIYSLSGDYLATYSNAISPALYIDNQIAYEWDGALTKLGEKQTMNIAVVSDGHKYEETKEMLVGTLNALIVDTQNISAQALYTALSRLPETEEDKAKVTENNFFNDKYAGNYLQLVGTTYFAEYDIQSKLLSSAREVYSERELSYGFISYIPEITESLYRVSISKTGSFQFDILGNIRSGVSYNGNADDEKTWRFADGYVSSLLESDVLEQFTGIDSVSTAAVLAEAEDEDIDIVVINSKNADIISTLELSAHDIQEITNEVNAGNTIITPCKNITVGNWTGTGYIVENETNGSLAFKLSSGLNGGSTTADVVPIMFIDAIISGADLAGSIAALCTAVSALLAASSILPIIGSVVMIGLAIYSLYATIDHILTVQGLWEDALDGDQAAIEQIKWECGFNVVISAATFGIGKGASAIANKAAKKTLVKYLGKEAGEAAEVTFKDNLTAAARFAKKASKQGVDDVALKILMQSPDCLGYGKNVLKSLGKLDSLAQTGTAEVLAKNGGRLASALNKSGIVDDAVKFISKYTDDGAELFIRYGDDVIKPLDITTNPQATISFIKEKGLDAWNKRFVYQHNPMDNPKAVADIIEDPYSVYGFRPNPESERLGEYASYDWSDPNVAEKARLNRINYHENNDSITELVEQMEREGASAEEIARAATNQRNQNRIASYEASNNLEGLEKMKKSNLEKYGDEMGPSADLLYEKYGSWEAIVDSSKRTNPGMDAVCGLYDKYYDMYGLE